MNKKNILLYIGFILILVGLFLPSIRIAHENVSFIQEAGLLPLFLVVAMIILLRLEKKEFIVIPSTIMIVIIFKFILKNIPLLKQINDLYGSYVKYQYGLFVLIAGNILILVSLLFSLLELEDIKERVNDYKLRKIEKAENTEKVSKGTSKDGKIKYNKVVVKVENTENLMNKFQIFKVKKANKNLSISKFDDTKETSKVDRTYEATPAPVVKGPNTVSVIDIQKWTRGSICCSNCGATVLTTSEYCFLCDCKIKLEKNVNYTKNV